MNVPRAFLLVGLISFGCGPRQAASPMMPPPLVTVAPAAARDVPAYIEEIGKCVAWEVVSVRPQASGRITEVHFTDGAELKKGDPLFTIDPRPYEAALAQAKASLAQNSAGLALAKLEFERVKSLVQTKAVSKEDYDTRENAVAVAEAQAAASGAAIDTAEVNLEYCFIKSPIDGRAGQRLVDQGNVVTATNPPTLLVIQRLDPVYADFTVTERDLPEVRSQMTGETLKAQVRFPDDPEASPREGDLTFLDNAVQDGTGTIKLRATLANADRRFWPGQFVRVRLVLSILHDAVLVPSQATQISQKGPYVYVVRPDSTAELRPVQIGQRQGDDVVVTEGLRAGENVVITGQLGVTPGQKVRVQPPPGAASGAPAKEPVEGNAPAATAQPRAAPEDAGVKP